MSQKDLLEKLKTIYPEEGDTINRMHLNGSINSDLNALWAKRIEKGLDLKEGTLDRWINKGRIIK